MLTWIAAGILIVTAATLVVLARQSRTAPEFGLVNGKLRPCSSAGNCVSSEPGPDAIAPLATIATNEDAWQDALAAVEACAGRIETVEESYLHASFRSRVFGFIDDLELRRDREAGVIHVRSASRVGGFDWGMNRRRIDQLRRMYSAQQGIP